ncbi:MULTISPECIES: hypothetical protein [unclassified Burkholderia]|uniref:hypothetical protein n=1 Tax=unclassified Burkholderia TaxID=2613784 RepID=UPI0011776877|nr:MULTISPECIES: hypothetical protein [unclassified Burkholderia]MBR8234204.1 hypothetical protein [Burkholderia sp. AU32357]
MKPSPLTLERLEFSTISIEVNRDYENGETNALPQLAFDFRGVNFRRSALLRYPHEEAADPKHFFCEFRLKITKSDQKKIIIPYELDIEVSALFTYLDDRFTGAERFRAVRFTAYQMLYGAIREMVSNLTARSVFGMLQLPSADFRQASREDSEKDEKERLELLAEQTPSPKPQLSDKTAIDPPPAKKTRSKRKNPPSE